MMKTWEQCLPGVVDEQGVSSGGEEGRLWVVGGVVFSSSAAVNVTNVSNYASVTPYS